MTRVQNASFRDDRSHGLISAGPAVPVDRDGTVKSAYKDKVEAIILILVKRYPFIKKSRKCDASQKRLTSD